MSGWTQMGGDGEAPEPSTHVHSTGMRLSLTEASAGMSDLRTDCTEPHHPSLGEYCPDCTPRAPSRLVRPRFEERL
jgi:hypothetical protein